MGARSPPSSPIAGCGHQLAANLQPWVCRADKFLRKLCTVRFAQYFFFCCCCFGILLVWFIFSFLIEYWNGDANH